MKIQCSVCEAAEATVLCCADEAALCYGCDEKVHAANKLASKHQRVSLSNSSSPMPKCDICQETVGYFFCLEDRALLCRKCDVSIHSINAHVAAHQRFLLTGVKVGLEPTERSPPSSSEKSHSPEKAIETKPRPLSENNNYVTLDALQVDQVGEFAPTKPPFGGGSDCGSFQQWQLDEIFGITNLNQNYNYIDSGSDKADSGKLGESDCSAILLAADFELDGDECLGHVPETAWDVPEIPSPPTASGLNWPNNYEHQVEITPAFFPDVCYSTRQDQYHDQQGFSIKRRRH
ncbi:B-box zinc finger protein 22 [Heracleum sosnowskyi]|uniref:B-box zinc finger protein 22 n=1 Tax=Heracleum sosnowskyi TaxID=360622 RepID=A0AAD8M7X8_9APIA|nr:B-box zinc finger protein 22 [Heracleum sosnowskyi]